jgi:hypothetical protein
MWNGTMSPQKDTAFLEWLKQAIKTDRSEVIDQCIEIVKKYRRFDNEEELQELNDLKKKV